MNERAFSMFILLGLGVYLYISNVIFLCGLLKLVVFNCEKSGSATYWCHIFLYKACE